MADFIWLTGIAVSNAFQYALEAPFERVKILLQCQNASDEIPPKRRYRGVIDAFKRVYKEQGLLSFWYPRPIKRSHQRSFVTYCGDRSYIYFRFDIYSS
jgi:hypothetical protein